MKLSLCITTYQRDDLTIKSFERVLHDPRINEIIIVDDHSDQGFFKSLTFKLDRINNPKIHLFRNDRNLDCYVNKMVAISRASNDWVIILDSDNVIGVDYLDALEEHFTFDQSIIYAPEFARPNFDYRLYSGKVFHKNNCGKHVHERQFLWMINTMNYCVHRDRYVRAWDGSINPHTADTALQNYNMLVGGCALYVVPGMQYDHLIHSGSHYKNNVHKTGNLFNELMEKFKLMK